MKLLELTKVECDFMIKLLTEWISRDTMAVGEAQYVGLCNSLIERIEETDDD